MKKRKRKHAWVRIAMVLAMILPLGLSLFANPPEASAAGEGSITIHKKKFETDTVTPAQNTGAEMTKFDGLENIDGAHFAIVPVTQKEWQNGEAAEDRQALALTYYESKKADLKTKTGETANGGVLKFDGLDLEQIYLVVELEPYPAGIDVPAAPMYVSLPYNVLDENDHKTDVILNDIHLYPKNEYIKGNVELIKLDQNLNDPIVGAKFRLYKDGVEIPNFDIDKNPVDEGCYTTDDAGKLILGNMLTGTYELREVKAADGHHISTEAEHFFFTVTYEDLKNPTKTKIIKLTNPKKTTKTADKDSYDYGETITWTMTQPVPALISQYKIFTFHDTLDSRLEYVNDSGSVTVKAADGSSVELVKEDDYTVTYAEDKRKVTFDFTEEGKGKLQGLIGEIPELPSPADSGNYKKATLTMVFQTVLKTNIPGVIENTPFYEFDNNPGGVSQHTPPKPGDTPSVETGGQKFIKIDASKTGAAKNLAKAEFKVYKKDGDKTLWYNVDKGDENKFIVTWVDSEAAATTLVSKDDGTFQVEGVEYGEYFLKETKPPKGYGLLSEPYKFTVSEDSYATEEAIEIKNSEAPELPITGGIGTVIFAVAGVILMSGAFLFYRKLKAA